MFLWHHVVNLCCVSVNFMSIQEFEKLTLASSSFYLKVKWMMYWIVFAFFTAVENTADVFISWSGSLLNFLPLYYAFFLFVTIQEQWRVKSYMCHRKVTLGKVKYLKQGASKYRIILQQQQPS